MRINFKKTLATFMAFGLFVGLCGQSFASDENIENKQTSSLFEILAGDVVADKATSEIKVDYADDPAFKEEFDARFALLSRIEEARNIEGLDLTDFIKLLNTKAADKDKLNTGLDSLNKLIEESGQNVDVDLDIAPIKAKVNDYILKGMLFYADKLDKTDVTTLHAYYEAVVGSLYYKNANEEGRKSYDETLKGIYETLTKANEKIEVGEDFTDEEKANFKDSFDKLDQMVKEKTSKPLKNETTSLRNGIYLASANEMNVSENKDGENKDDENKINENSAFYKSAKTGIKEAYEKLSADQRKKLDQMNTNNDDLLSDDELKADGEFTLPLSDDHYFKPFTANVSGSSSSTDTSSSQSTTSGSSTSQTTTPSTTTSTSSQTPTTTAQSPIGGTPETVTIGGAENKSADQIKKEDDKKDAPTNTTSTSYVKTGIKGIAYVGIILLVAIGAYTLLNKNKDKK